MVTAGESDDARLAASAQVSGFERGLDGFKSCIAKDRLACACAPALEGNRAQFLAQGHFDLSRMDVAHAMQQQISLTFERRDYRWITVP